MTVADERRKTASRPRKATGDVLPSNVDMERSFLGFCLADPNVLAETRDVLRPEDFSFPKYRETFEAFAEMYTAQELTADANLLAKALVTRGVFPDGNTAKAFVVGDLLDADSMANHMYSAQYAEELHALAMKRELIRLSWEIPAIVQDGEGTDIGELLGQVEQRVFDVTQKDRERRTGLVEVGQCFDEMESRLSMLANGGVLDNGLPTGIESLDHILAGFKPGDLVILAARPAQGKSAVSLNIAYHAAAVSRMPVCFFSLEMAKDQLASRLIASVARVNIRTFEADYFKLNSGGYEQDPRLRDHIKKRLIAETKRLLAAKEHLRKVPLLIDDTAGLTLLDINSATRRVVMESDRKYGTKLGLVVIDYLQLMQPVSKRASSNRQEEVAEISRGLKLMAKDLGVPVLALAQLSRNVESRTDKRPILSDLRESGAIEQDADIVMFIYRPHSGEPETEDDTDESRAVKKMKGEIIVAKHRSGPVGEAHVIIDDEYTLFRSVPPGSRVGGVEAYVAEFWKRVHKDGEYFFTVPDADIPAELAEYRTQATPTPRPEAVADELGLNDEPEPASEPVRTITEDGDSAGGGDDEAYFDQLVKGKSGGAAKSLLADFLDDEDDIAPERLEEA